MRGARIIRWSIRWVMFVSSRMAYEPRFHVKEERQKVKRIEPRCPVAPSLRLVVACPPPRANVDLKL